MKHKQQFRVVWYEEQSRYFTSKQKALTHIQKLSNTKGVHGIALETPNTDPNVSGHTIRKVFV
jgi:hypothetical protein